MHVPFSPAVRGVAVLQTLVVVELLFAAVLTEGRAQQEPLPGARRVLTDRAPRRCGHRGGEFVARLRRHPAQPLRQAQKQ